MSPNEEGIPYPSRMSGRLVPLAQGNTNSGSLQHFKRPL